MKKLKLESLDKQKDFTMIDCKNFEVVFTNAEMNRSFNRNTEEGINEINSLQKEFNVDDVIYLKQIHSDKVLEYKSNIENIKNEEGDAIITNEKNVIIGVFTADCVPIILFDQANGAAAAIHSGWRGTFESITFKTIEKMKERFNTEGKDVIAYIGPHIRKCCYEVSEELKEKFIEKKNSIEANNMFNGRNLNLEACIISDLKRAGVEEHNINSIDLCTYCSDDIKLHSYRKSEGSYGRMFSFIILR
ncbi:peptidoglycan editing factor PgeF [Clostridium saccharobutylicum]|uniref:Purine nucleoside phosphorylase n=1 Tax=Clostridium saccharobutylicum TaxID=169679 RepID=A0A1S8NBI1_CLOSA|nr:peptidoglycan editing factor PgeF [Clostridium saccharobutylicum]OOM13631.1 laccase domain protein YfiH [Clostridium saccharobutylicum]